MIDSDPAGLLLAMVAGAALGGVYFGGLWLTLRALPRRRRPGLLLAVSLLLRLAVVLGGLYLIVAGGQWARLLAALAGLVAVRSLLTRRLGTVRTGSGAAL